MDEIYMFACQQCVAVKEGTMHSHTKQGLTSPKRIAAGLIASLLKPVYKLPISNFSNLNQA